MEYFSPDEFSYRQWPGDSTGLSLQRVKTSVEQHCFSRTTTTERIYRYKEGPMRRDQATRFYDNPYLLMVGVQRVAVVDEDAGEIMVCTPARAAAWMVLRDRGRKDAVLSEVNQLDDITQTELDKVLKELHRSRNGSFITDPQVDSTKMVVKAGDTLGRGDGKSWKLTGFSENGGWATYFAQVMKEGSEWLAVIHGQTTSADVRTPPEPGKYDLVFKDNESELLYGEGRSFRREHDEILGVQLRRGFCVVRAVKSSARPETPGFQYDQFILPDGLSPGVYNQKARLPMDGLTWRIRSGESLTHYTIGEEILKISK